MNLLILGRGKTGSLVAEVAREREHTVRVIGSDQNQHARALTAESLNDADVVIDFTTSEAALENIRACLRARKNMVVGTTGWYGFLSEIRREVEAAGTGFLYASNFSVGVNTFFAIARAAAPAMRHGYDVRIAEKHHEQKKDAPSGTALTLRDCLQPNAAQLPDDERIQITSIREGDFTGQHIIYMDSPSDTLMLVHDAKSRRGFAEGAVTAAEWLRGKRGFFTFADVLRSIDAEKK